MTALVHDATLAERADALAGRELNGLELVVVRLEPAGAPAYAELDVSFHNERHVAAIAADASPPRDRFPIRGGRRRRGGAAPGDVQVTAIAATGDPRTLRLTVAPVGDYATYTLAVEFAGIDPVFDELPFKFRPGCFTTNCTPRPAGAPRPAGDPGIDYTAKDHASFRHVLIAAMDRRLPGWTPTSEVDLTTMLIDQLAVAADELSDFQDRAVNERALGTARGRVSLARHARLVDYHVHQGNQARTWLALTARDGVDEVLPVGLVAATRDGRVRFESRDERRVHTALNELVLYTWRDARPGLAAGSTSADLALASLADGTRLAQLIRNGEIGELVFWEARDPDTGQPGGRDPAHRQLVRLLPDATAAIDPLTDAPYLTVRWRAEDALVRACCAVVFRDGAAPIRDITRVAGNLVQVHHGARRDARFLPDELRRTAWGTLAVLPRDAAVLYRDTPPGGEVPPISTITITITTAAGVFHDWEEDISLVHARAEDPVFAVETDEDGRSVVRFGDGVHGAALPDDAIVDVTWQSGLALAGNVGHDAIATCAHPALVSCWNPFDVTSGRAPESREVVVRRAPELYRARQLRWVSLSDVVARAEEIDGVARAAARYAWTGSWTAVQLAIDPGGTETLTDELRRRVADQLAPLALIGDDLELRAPRFVPLHVRVDVCLHPDYWADDVRAAIEDELSDGHTADGRRGLFHPDAWTFGQTLHASQVIGRIQAVAGVAHVISIDLQRYRAPTPGPGDRIEVAPFEIITVHNDPDDMERGLIEILPPRGGRG